MEDLLFTSAQAQLDALNSGTISAVELARLHVAHIQKTHPYINAVVQLDEDYIFTQAQDADQQRAGGTLQPLLGLPVSVKDSWETQRLVSASGTLARKGYIPKRDAEIVKRVRDAGAVILCKTNCPELVLPYETSNLIYGRTNNPHNLEHSPGGSTGGEAALIAIGGSPLGLAGDAAASIRTPSHFCGITGIKPTTGRVPRTGHFPQMGGISGALASAGPIARTVDDLMLVLPLLCGGDGVDSACAPVPYYDPHLVDISQLNIAFYTDNGIMSADDETVRAIHNTVQSLEKMGATITDVVPDGLDSVLMLFNSIFGADGGERIQDFIARLGVSPISTPLQKLLERMSKYKLSSADLMSMMGRWDKYRSQMLAFITEYDVIICPVAAHPAPLHGTLLGADASERLSYTIAYNLVGYPSASVPVTHSSAGLPIGVQVVAGPWREDKVLAVAKAIETIFGGYQRPPMNWYIPID